MLFLGSRDDGRKGLGLGFRGGERGAMEENELEEGEACSGLEGDVCIDPDTDFSYIGEKLQDVLGHFQKDFEGGVSAENLGAKFGGYGSFLPAYQRSPSILAQPRSPPRPPNHTISRSPHNSSLENVRQNPSVLTSASFSKNNTSSTALSLDNSGKRDNCLRSVSAGGCVPHIDFIKPVNGSDQKSLKVRIKVGPDNSLARNNAAIYSGLGLDISPSSSPEDSPDGSGGLSPEFRDVPGESPVTILQVMTCFPVLGGYLLSPLHKNLFQLTEKESSFIRKTGVLCKGVPETCVVADLTLPMRDLKGYSDKKIKSNEKNGRLMDEENSNCKGDTGKMLKKEIDIETPASQKLASNALNMSLQSSSRGADAKAERQIIGDPAKGTSRTSDLSKEPNKISVMDRISLPDLPKDGHFVSTESMKSSGVGSSGNKTAHSKGKLNPKSSLVDKALEERNKSNRRDASSDMVSEGKSKTQKKNEMVKLNSDGYEGRNDYIAGHAEPIKQMPAQKANSHEKDGGKRFQGNDQVYEGKRKQKGSHDNCEPSIESTKENLRAPSSVVSKEKKKSSRARGDHSENKSKMLKSRIETSRGHSRESHRDDMGNANAERVENRADLLEPFTFTEKSKGRPGLKKDGNLRISEPLADAQIITPSTCTAPTSDAAAALHAPVVIKENWVLCDKCQKWRLLPYGTDPDHLPKKWKCSMQVWLPGLNRCDISEEETTKALNELYLVPAPGTGANLSGHHDIAASSIISADALHFDQIHEQNMQSVPTTGKKKHGLMDASNLPNHSASKNLPASVKSRRSNDPLETNLLIKSGLGLTSKSIDITTEKLNHKQKEKHKIPGDFIGKSGKHSKSKSKREVDQDGYRTSKKIKKEGSHYLDEDRHSDLDMAGKATPNMDNGLSTKVTGKILQNYSDYSSSKDLKCELKDNLSASIKRSKDSVHVFSNGEFKEHFSASDVEKSGTLGFAAKKRKLKEWQESQGNMETVMSTQHALDNKVIVKEAFSESELRRQEKAKVSKSEGKESVSNADGKMDRSGCLTRILLSGTREHPPDGMVEEGRVVAGKEQMGHYQESASRRASDGIDSLKMDTAYAQIPTAATSSSSKLSGSRRSKANFQEARGSPVESVSSSPLRIFDIEKLSSKRNSAAKDDAMHVGPSFMGSPKRCSDGEVDGGSDQSGTRRKETTSSIQLRSSESLRAAESGVLDSLRGMCDYQDKEANHLSGGKVKDGLYLNRGTQDDLPPAEFEETNVVGNIGNILDQHNKYLCEHPEGDNTHDRNKLNNHHRANGSSQRKSGKSSSLCFRERSRTSNSDANRGKLKVSDSVSDQKELYSRKNGSSCQSGADFKCHDDSTYHKDLRDENYNFQEKDYLGKKNSIVKWPYLDRRDNHSNYEIEENLDAQHKDFNSRVTFTGASCCKSNLQENLQQSPSHPSEIPSRFLSDRTDRSEMASGRGISQSIQPSKDKHEAQSWGPQIAHTPIKGSRSEPYPIDAVNGDALKVVKQSRKPDSQNGVHPNILRQATPNSHDASSPMRKDGPSVANVVLKEARDLKHTANRLKSEGLDHESIGLYFEAALKFLHCASLLEPPSAESAKLGELNPSMQMMQMYSDTARLCEYCAHEYERCKEMAAAALAYKCVEVAYMKVAYYKHPCASKDRHELQTAVQMVLPGESPSSSASDVDNLNNQGTLDKTASAKAVVSPQIAGNHVIAARNRPHFARLLGYTNDLNSAFEATKRSQNAIAAASVSVKKDAVDGMSSVRKVLDFNFHNVEGLLRLVRLSMESISR